MNVEFAPSITDAYKRDGFVSRLPICSVEDMSHIRKEVLKVVEYFDYKRAAIRQCHQYFPWAYDLVTNEKLLDHVASILGPDIFIRASMLLLKFPHSPSVVLWHSDNAYSTMGKTPSVSAWVAISRVTKENGCLKIVGGSHTKTFAHHYVTNEHHQLRTCLTTVEDPHPDSVTYLTLDPGQTILFNPFLLHASERSISDEMRIGFSIRFMTPDFPPISKKETWIRARGNAPAPKNVRFIDQVDDGPEKLKFKQLLEYNTSTEQ